MNIIENKKNWELIINECNLDSSFADRFEELWLFYEKKMMEYNFTAIKDRQGFEIKHFIDSILPVKNNNLFKDGDNVIDIGTGGGFPSIPLAIIYPKVQFTLLDSVLKNIKMLEHLKDKFNFDNVNFIHDRAEFVAHNKNLREKFDFVLSRALAKWPLLLELCIPFLKIGGTLLAYKGREDLDVLDNYKEVIADLGGNISGIYKYDLPLDYGKRTLFMIEKIVGTPDVYPRKPKMIKKNPL